MTNKEKYKEAFSVLHSSADISLEMEKLAVRKNRRKTMKWACAVLAVFTVTIIGLSSVSNLKEQVIYASEYDCTAMWDYEEEDKITIQDAIHDVKGNPRIRVAVLIRDLTDGYPDIESDVGIFEGYTFEKLHDYETKADTRSDDGGRTSEEEYYKAYENLMKKMIDEEKDFFEKAGAEDIVVQKNNTIVCTIRKNNIKNLSDGKCKYVVVMYTKNDEDMNDINIEDYYGQYSEAAFVGVPVFSSAYQPSVRKNGNVEGGRLIMNEEQIEVMTTLGIAYSADHWTYEKVTADSDMDTYDMVEDIAMYISYGSGVDLFEFMNTMKAEYKITNESGDELRLFITMDGIYVNFDLGGIYRFKN